MTLLDRHIARRLLAALFKILLSMVLLVVVIDLLTHLRDDVVKYAVPWRVVGLYYLTFVPTILFEYQAAALAVLVAGVMVLGRAAQDNEMTAALAGGVGLRRLARAPILIALAMALAAFVVEETVGVRSLAVAGRIKEEYFAGFTRDERKGVSWANLGEQGQWTCHILKFNETALTGEDVYLHSVHPDWVEEIQAARIFWDGAREQWILERGWHLKFDPEAGMEETGVRITQQAAPFREPPSALFALNRAPETKTAAALARDLRRAESLGWPVGRLWVDYHAKFARPALCFVMIWLAIPFAMRIRRGGAAAGLGLSILTGLAYLLVFYISLGLGRLGQLPPFWAAWLANIVFFGAGVWLFRKTPT